MKEFMFKCPEIHFGPGMLEQTGEIVKGLGYSKAMIVTDNFLATCGVGDRLKKALADAGIHCEMFSEVSPSPKQSEAIRCNEQLKASGGEVVIGLGGGSPMDVAKGAALLMNNPAPLDQYVGVDMLPNKPLPIIAIPSTSGTGSEASNAAILKNEETGIKAGIISQKLIPTCAIVDPDLTLTLPPKLTAACGMDALSHAIEGFTGLKATPVTQVFQREAIMLISGNLRKAVGCGSDRQARYNMSLGSLYAGIGMAMSGCAGVHALAYPMEGIYRVTHGDANAILLPEVMRFNAKTNIEQYAELAGIMGLSRKGLAERDKALWAADAVKLLCEDISIPRLSDIGVKAEDIPGLAAQAVQVKRLVDNNPRTLTEEGAVEIYKASF